ncbi:hypothetical protein SDC9_170969 [bioreactor metagenome]|uniref:Uncharacterized protein n=1 Tax=bioreactor metagenome TaxID=1076179 RepID=A0A645G9J4_9ZZZZ
MLLEHIASIGDILDAFTAGKYTPIIIAKNPTINASVTPSLEIVNSPFNSRASEEIIIMALIAKFPKTIPIGIKIKPNVNPSPSTIPLILRGEAPMALSIPNSFVLSVIDILKILKMIILATIPMIINNTLKINSKTFPYCKVEVLTLFSLKNILE